MTHALRQSQDLMARLPAVKGRLSAHVSMADLTWFRVGGPADVFFLPADAQDLSHFLGRLDRDIPVTVVGVGSNLLVRDGGVPGVVIRLAGGFNRVTAEPGARVRAGAGALDVTVAKRAGGNAIAGLEFLRGIPGSVGGALRMNAGAYGREIKDVLVTASALDRQGQRHELTVQEMGFGYRHSSVPGDIIFIEAVFQGAKGDAGEIATRMKEISQARETTQPIRSRTGGSTFKNPDPEESGGKKAWQLIDGAGCRGLVIGDAQVSEQHCNFLINRGRATAEDLEKLGETVRSKVANKSRITLQWEIQRIGCALNEGTEHHDG